MNRPEGLALACNRWNELHRRTSVITRIELTNFMSHQRTVIEPAPGVTVLVGPNNCGKSAVVAALQILSHNENSTYVKRHGAKDCSVVVHTDDGQVIEWRRKTAPSYVINGQVFDRLKSGPLPEELHRALKLPGVDADGGAEFDVHFGAQKSPIFLLEKSGAQAARFFAASSDAIRLVAMQKRHKDKLADAQREKTRLENESRKLNSQLAILEPVVALDDQLQAVEAAHLDLQQRQQELAAAEALIARLREAIHTQARCASEARALSALAGPPLLAATEPLTELIQAIQTAVRTERRSHAEVEACSELAAPPALADLRPLQRRTQQLHQQLEEASRLNRTQGVLTALTPPPEYVDVTQLRVLLEDLISCNAAVAKTQQRVAALQSLIEPPRCVDTERMARDVRELARRSQRVEECRQLVAASGDVTPPPVLTDANELTILTQQLAKAVSESAAQTRQAAQFDEELVVLAAQLREVAADQHCPVCGGSIDPDRMLQHTAAHGELPND